MLTVCTLIYSQCDTFTECALTCSQYVPRYFQGMYWYVHSMCPDTFTVWYVDCVRPDMLTVWYVHSVCLDMLTVWYVNSVCLDMFTVWYAHSVCLGMFTVCTLICSQCDMFTACVLIYWQCASWFVYSVSSLTQRTAVVPRLSARMPLALRCCSEDSHWPPPSSSSLFRPWWFPNDGLLR